jgi:hypothetical protein
MPLVCIAFMSYANVNMLGHSSVGLPQATVGDVLATIRLGVAADGIDWFELKALENAIGETMRRTTRAVVKIRIFALALLKLVVSVISFQTADNETRYKHILIEKSKCSPEK